MGSADDDAAAIGLRIWEKSERNERNKIRRMIVPFFFLFVRLYFFWLLLLHWTTLEIGMLYGEWRFVVRRQQNINDIIRTNAKSKN